MCGRITLLTYEELLDAVMAVEQGRAASLRARAAAEPRAQARPGDAVYAIAPDGAALKLRRLTWGFALGDGKKLVFNTRIESALSGSRMWADAMQNGRCILPVASFFEPHGTEKTLSPKTGRAMKRQYEFFSEDARPASGNADANAGITSNGDGETNGCGNDGCGSRSGAEGASSGPGGTGGPGAVGITPARAVLLLASIHDGRRLSVVTTEPNAVVAPVHPRMPLVLRFEEVGTWLRGNFETLADRSSINLATRQEPIGIPKATGRQNADQLSLFPA